MDFNGGQVSDRRGLGGVGLLRGSPTAEDAAAGSVEAFTTKFGHFGPAALGWSRSTCGAGRKDPPPLPAVPGGGCPGQGHRGGRAESTGTPPAVQAQVEGLAVTLSLILNCIQIVMVRPRVLSQTVPSK